MLSDREKARGYRKRNFPFGSWGTIRQGSLKEIPFETENGGMDVMLAAELEAEGITRLEKLSACLRELGEGGLSCE